MVAARADRRAAGGLRELGGRQPLHGVALQGQLANGVELGLLHPQRIPRSIVWIDWRREIASLCDRCAGVGVVEDGAHLAEEDLGGDRLLEEGDAGVEDAV